MKPSIAAIRATMRYDVLETLSAPVAGEGLTTAKIAHLFKVSEASVKTAVRELLAEGKIVEVTKPRQRTPRYKAVST